MKLIEYRKIARAVEDDLRAALAKHGFKMKPCSARIDEGLGIVRMTIEAVDINHKAPDGSATTPERELYKQLASLYDLKPEWLGAEFSLGRTSYKLEGLMAGRRAKNVSISRVPDGKTFICTPEDVQRAFVWMASRKQAAAS